MSSSSSSTLSFTTPVLVAVFIVITTYLLKKDDRDPNKVPNYPIIFVSSFVVTGGILYVASGNGNGTQTGGDFASVMSEIDVGEPPF
jgi:preprotein translocase subunit SecG